MYAAVEHGPVLCSDSNILCLSWKGRVPKSEKEKPVCRRRYYEEGWLATGNGRGVVGVTFTSSHCRRDRNTPQRINFNLRGHNSEVVLVRWNEPYQKLATCDADGGIFVWIQYEGRWSVELVNDRGAQVSDFTWSHDGTQALISYRDGFVLVGSVSGQRHWSSEINLESQITCGIWTPDDQQVLFGTADGQVIVMDCHGRMLAHVLLHESDGILSMSWNYPAFLVEDSSESDTDSDDYSPPQDGPAAYPIPVQNVKPLLTVSFTSGDISLMNNYDDLSPTVIQSGLKEVVAQWCTQGDLLAVAGMERPTQLGDLPNGPLLKSAMVKFYNVRGEHIFTLDTLVQRPIISICWGHRDSRLLMASGPALYVVRVEHRVSSLQLLCQQAIASALREDKDVSKLTLPPRLCSYLSTAFIPTIKPPIPDPSNMRDFVSYPSTGSERLHCTMKRTEDDPEVGGPCYTLYLEHLGGLVPILKGRRISKLRPEFVIMDPRTDGRSDEIYGNSLISTMIDSCNCSDSSDIELSDDWAAKKSPKISRASKSPKLPRINIEARKSPKLSRAAQEISRSPRLPMRKPSIGSPSLTRREFPFEDITQHNYLAQVTSNIWGTKFKIVGLAAFLPTNLGAVIYKTSLLHLQPRQMTIYLPEVRKISMDFVNLPVFNPNVFSEDEDDLPVTGASGVPENNPPCTVNIPIAPIHSSAQAMSPTQSIGLVQSLLANQNVQLDVLTNQTTAVGAAEHASDSAAQYPVASRYSSPGQVIFGGVEMSRVIPNPPQLSLPPPAQGAIQLSVLDHGDRDHEHLQKPAKALRPVPQLATEGDAVVFSAPQESSYSLLSAGDGARERADYVNSAFTEDEALAQHCQAEKPLRHPQLSEAAVAVKRPPPYQWDPVLGEDVWVPQERTAQTAVPNPLKLSPLMVGQSQHLDVSRVPFVSPKPPASPTATFQTGYGMGVPYPGGYNTSALTGVQAPCSPKDALAPAQFAQQESAVVLQTAYPPSLSYCPLPPMYPGSSACSSLQLPPIALHPWNSYSACPPVQNPQGALPPKAHLVVEKPLVSPPPTDLQTHLGTEVMVETADNFQEVLSLTESPVPQRTEKFGKKNRKRLDSRAEEGNVQAITEGKVKKEARTLSDFNSLISSPRLGREKKKVKSQKDQLKSKKLNKTNEFQDSSESEPELFVSGDELMNQSQGSKKGWKSKRSLRAASELEEFKCRKASEKEDGRLGSQGFVYVMANKQPLWNEATQVYQLDFGGRVTQESAKNFQIELEGRQVMQFGRIDGNAYILDFQYPFSAVQAFAVALANVTQRLK
ncbi:tubby-related protein 4 [Neophocaena asiaeorientalis asiaeorientalis]|uniref:Tubby-related protein 4 n=1 Tax=Neophocaena asiaeorientalis asiaeorientalis TaxID=1706337 RepID=A0A341BLJ2_NEOAA|nr:tubby-related protein 4 [Neophocaena asiaeorientalis asiaeorientalis]